VRKLVTTLTFMLLTACMAEALTLRQYIAFRDGKDKSLQSTIKAYITGLGEGLSWGTLKAEPRIYCVPDKLALTGNDYISILNRSIEKEKSHPSFDEFLNQNDILGLFLLEGLKETFPCDKK
jgi:hypothetical protein